MNSKKNIVLIVVVVLVVATLAFFFLSKNGTKNPPINPATPLQGVEKIPAGEYEELSFPDNNLDTSDWETYRNEEFGFEVRYPKNIVSVSDIRASEMKEMYEFGFYLNWHLGRVDIAMRTAKIGMNIYVYDKNVDTMFKMYSDLNKSPSDTIGVIPVNNTSLFFLIANKGDKRGYLFHYSRAYFAGNGEHAYEIVFTEIPEEHKKIFQGIISSFKLIK